MAEFNHAMAVCMELCDKGNMSDAIRRVSCWLIGHLLVGWLDRIRRVICSYILHQSSTLGHSCCYEDSKGSYPWQYIPVLIAWLTLHTLLRVHSNGTFMGVMAPLCRSTTQSTCPC